MSLEKSVLTQENIQNILHTHYGIVAETSRKLPLGSANCFIIESENQKFFLKEFQSAIKSDAILREAELTEYLSKKDFPAAQFIKAASGLPFIIFGGHIICLEEYIDGKAYGYNDFPAELLSDCAGTLGKLHTVLKDYSLPGDMDKKWVDEFSAEELVMQYASLAKKAKNQADTEKREKIINSLIYKKGLAMRCAEYKKYFEDITYSPTHGDYQGCQLICDDNAVKAVVDFSSARTLPAIWEIMRSFVQTSECRRTRKINIDALCAYVYEYMRFSPLTKRDLCAMPYVYLFQLARSKYGYPQYLNADSEDKEGLIDFALWRTEICMELEDKAEKISQALKTLI